MQNRSSNAPKTVLCAMLLGATGLLAACADTGNHPPLDVGSMGLPTSSQQAATITFPASRSTSFDTGNMAYPVPLPQGVISQTASQARYPDTGNMALPDPRPQGDFTTKPR